MVKISLDKKKLLTQLFNNFLNANKEIEAIIISDKQGEMITGEKRDDLDMEVISILTTIINPIIARIRDEFEFQKFGTASFDTDDHRLLFISLDDFTKLSLVIEYTGSIDKITPYAYYLAEKAVQVLIAKDLSKITIPDFKYEIKAITQSARLKHQVYHNKFLYNKDYKFKMILVGDGSVGKTSIIHRFVDNLFSKDYRSTLGLNILTNEFEAFGCNVNLLIWDVGGQDHYNRVRQTYFRGTQAAFIVFDLTSRETFENLNIWNNELREFTEDPDLPIIIIGNKNDLVDQREVSYEEGVKFAEEMANLSTFYDPKALSVYYDLSELAEKKKGNISYIETSALTGERIEDAFSLISYSLISQSTEKEELRLKAEIISKIKSILKENKSLTLSFIDEDLIWSPGVQILIEIASLGLQSKMNDKENEKVIEYPNGLVLKNYTYGSFKISDSDGIFSIFDAREKEHIEPKWNNIIINILDEIKEHRVILIGIRVPKDIKWSQLINEFQIDKQLKKKEISILFFKISDEFRMEIFDQLIAMLNTIENDVHKF